MRRREIEEEGQGINADRIKDIDELVELAKLDTRHTDRSKKKRKKSALRTRSTIEDALGRIKPNCSDSNLKSLDVTSRLDRWYQKASAMALVDVGDDKESFESYSGSESDDMAKQESALRKGKSLDGIDVELESFTPSDLLDKWMRQKKNSLIVEERGRSASETSVEPISTPEESDSSVLSVAKDVGQHERFSPMRGRTSTPLVIDRIIISQPSTDESKEQLEDTLGTNLPNQPIFYIPNFKGEEKSKTTVILQEEESKDALIIQKRPRSRSEINTGTIFDKRDAAVWKEIEKMAEKRSRSFGSMNREGNLEAVVKQERLGILPRTESDHGRKSRPHSLIVGSDTREKNCKKELCFEDGLMVQEECKTTYANANIYQNERKHEKGNRLSRLPGKGTSDFFLNLANNSSPTNVMLVSSFVQRSFYRQIKH